MNHVYVHVPFCRRRCSYCDFAIAVRRTVPSDAFVSAIDAERRIRGDPSAVQTLYLGGGTPSLLSTGALERLLDGFARSAGGETTIEANPDDVIPSVAAVWRRLGITRVSLGAQSFDENILRWMHRTHDAAQTARAATTLRDAGLVNLSLDLIFGLPDHLAGVWERDLDAALALAPEHLSLYGLTVEPRTPLARWHSRGMTVRAPDERYGREFLLAHERLTREGYEHYEVSNYARPGRRSRHNQSYWSGASYVGFGPSAHGFDGERRRWNVRDWADYEARVSGGADPLGGDEIVSGPQRELEGVYLGLRTASGIRRDAAALTPAAVESAIARGLLVRDGERLRCTARGWLLLDELAVTLTTSAQGG